MVFINSFDGDPEKLALYIVALAKKVEDDQASRARCIDDLEVFLETNTHKFVDSLFETLISKKYLTSPGTSSSSSAAKTSSVLSNINTPDSQVDSTSSKNNNTNDSKTNISKLNNNTRSRHNFDSHNRFDQSN